MKKTLSILALVCAVSISAFSQEAKPEAKKNNHSERIEAEKVAFITKMLDLSVEEAQAFWPVYNKADKSQKALAKAEREAYKALNQAIRDKMDETEISARLNAYISASQSNVNMHMKAKKEYEKVLPAAKVAKFYVACERFRRLQIRNLQSQNAHGAKPQGAKPQNAKPQPGSEPQK